MAQEPDPNYYSPEKLALILRRLQFPKPIQNVLGIQSLDNMIFTPEALQDQAFKETIKNIFPLLWQHASDIHIGKKCRLVIVKINALTGKDANVFIDDYYVNNHKFRSIRQEMEKQKELLASQAAQFGLKVLGNWLRTWREPPVEEIPPVPNPYAKVPKNTTKKGEPLSKNKKRKATNTTAEDSVLHVEKNDFSLFDEFFCTKKNRKSTGPQSSSTESLETLISKTSSGKIPLPPIGTLLDIDLD